MYGLRVLPDAVEFISELRSPLKECAVAVHEHLVGLGCLLEFDEVCQQLSTSQTTPARSAQIPWRGQFFFGKFEDLVSK